MENLLKAFPVVLQIPVAWGEMDSLQHVNNTVYFRYFESARVAYFDRIGMWKYMEETGTGPILASTECRFRIPLTFPDTVSVGTRIPKIEEDRFLMEYRVVSQHFRKVAAEGEGIVVSYDYRSKKKVPLPEELKRRILDLESLTANR